jgi:predicted TPR repeat methyltransferase
LNDTGRYTHAISYLNKLANGAEFNILETKEAIIRENDGKPVIGHLSLWLVDAE